MNIKKILENLEPEDIQVLREFLGSHEKKVEDDVLEGAELLETVPTKELNAFYKQIEVLGKCKGFSIVYKSVPILVPIVIKHNLTFEIKKGKAVFDKSTWDEQKNDSDDFDLPTHTVVMDANVIVYSHLADMQTEIDKLRELAKDLCSKYNLSLDDLLWEFDRGDVDINFDFDCTSAIRAALYGIKKNKRKRR